MAASSGLSRVSLPAKFGIGAGLLVLVAVAYYFVFHTDVSSSIEAAERQEATLRDQLAEARKKEFAYQKDLAELTDRQQRQRDLNKILPPTTESASFLSSLQSVANVAGISLAAWTPQDEVVEQYYARVPMSIELEGRYHQIAKFFYGVGQLDRIINMEDIAIREPRQEGDEYVLKVTAMATAFHMNQKPDGPAPAEPKKK